MPPLVANTKQMIVGSMWGQPQSSLHLWPCLELHSVPVAVGSFTTSWTKPYDLFPIISKSHHHMAPWQKREMKLFWEQWHLHRKLSPWKLPFGLADPDLACSILRCLLAISGRWLFGNEWDRCCRYCGYRIPDKIFQKWLVIWVSSLCSTSAGQWEVVVLFVMRTRAHCILLLRSLL